MTDEKLQFAISQYVDDMLMPEERRELEARLESDAEARKLLAEYQQINQLMEAALPVPEVNWDDLAGKISAAVDAGALPHPAAMEAEQRRSAWQNWRGFAIAAMLMIAATVAVFTITRRDRGQMAGDTGKRGTAEIKVYAVALPKEPAIAEVSVGPGPIVAFAPASVSYPAELTVSNPPRVTIAGVPLPDEDWVVLH